MESLILLGNIYTVMKRVLLTIVSTLLVITSFGQITKSGTLSVDETWSSGPIYVIGDLTVSSGVTLAITEGVEVYISQNVNIFIDGTLNALGSSASPVLFSADSDFDGHETGETWGHIYYRHGGTGNLSYGTINYCIFEYANPGTSSTDHGGAIKIGSNNVTISNSVFRYNQAGWGGAIFIGAKTIDPNSGTAIPITTSISNCYFDQNTAQNAGGAIYFWNYCGGTVNNSVFTENSVVVNTSSTRSGGAIASIQGGSPGIINCDFINNSSNNNPAGGDDIMFYTGSPHIANCVFWGSSDPFYTGNYSRGAFSYCASSATYPSSFGSGSAVTFTDCFNINTSNTASDGPNFTDPSSGDWTIAFISPLRDAGTTPSPTVPTDYVGNSRVGNYDIGAYEVTYSRWSGATSTSWGTSTNWAGGYYPGSPDATGDIIIPNGLSNYPTATAPTVNIGADKYFIVESQAKATVGSLTNNGTLRLESDSEGSASVIMGFYSRGFSGGTEEVQMYLSGGSSPANKWHYISIPMASFVRTPFSNVTLNFARYEENSLLGDGWIAYDGYHYDDGIVYPADAFTYLTLARGYNFYDNVDNTITFGGFINTSSVADISLEYSGAEPDNLDYGFNLLGNPFTSGLDWDAIVYVGGDVEGEINTSFPENTSTAIHFTQDDEQVSYVAGVLSSGGDFDGIIPPMQGFFLKTNTAGNTITLPNTARAHGGQTTLFKGNAKSAIPLIRLGIGQGSEIYNKTVVRFNEKADQGLDNYYDAYKMMKKQGRNYISTTVAGTEYSINGIPFPGEGASFEIPVTLTLAEEADFNITVTDLNNLDDYQFSIVDLSTNDTTELETATTLAFHAAAGDLNDRFVLIVTPRYIPDDGGDDGGDNGGDDDGDDGGDIPTAVHEVTAGKTDFTIYQSYNMINIIPAATGWDGTTARVTIINMTGQRIASHNGIGMQTGMVSSVDAPAAKGLYLVEILGSNSRYVGKVIIR